jgi:hypothetical protein
VLEARTLHKITKTYLVLAVSRSRTMKAVQPRQGSDYESLSCDSLIKPCVRCSTILKKIYALKDSGKEKKRQKKKHKHNLFVCKCNTVTNPVLPILGISLWSFFLQKCISICNRQVLFND